MTMKFRIFALQLFSSILLATNIPNGSWKTPCDISVSSVTGRFSKKTGLYSETLNPAVLNRLMKIDEIKDEEEADPGLIAAAKYHRYTRFTADLLEDNIAAFMQTKKAVPDYMVTLLLDKEAEFDLKKKLIINILDLCSIVLPEDNTNRLVFPLIEKKKKVLNELFEPTSDALQIIATDGSLTTKALQMIKNHIFFNLKPFIYAGDADDSPQNIKESAMETLRLMYKLLDKFLDVRRSEVAAYDIIDNDEELPEKLFLLLSVPDLDERNQVVVTIAKLFGYHSKFAKKIATLISNRFDYMSKIGPDFHFLYVEVISALRLCLMIFFEYEYPNDEEVGQIFAKTFHLQFIPLLKLHTLPKFSNQWEFMFANSVDYFPIEEMLKDFQDNLFIPTGRPNYNRDTHLCTIYNDIYHEIEIPSALIPSYIQFIFEAAAELRIRPRLIDEALDVFIGENSHVYADFNMIDGEKRYKVDLTIRVYVTIGVSLRRLYVALHNASMDTGHHLGELIDLWDLTDDFENFIKSKDDYSELLADYKSADLKYTSAMTSFKPDVLI